MHKGNRKSGDLTSAKAPLELVARFLAAQRWSTDIYRPEPVDHNGGSQDRSRYAMRISEYMDLHWREYVGPAQLLIRTCLKSPTRSLLNDICTATSLTEDTVMTVWRAGVEHTASEVTIPEIAISEMIPPDTPAVQGVEP